MFSPSIKRFFSFYYFFNFIFFVIHIFFFLLLFTSLDSLSDDIIERFMSRVSHYCQLFMLLNYIFLIKKMFILFVLKQLHWRYYWMKIIRRIKLCNWWKHSCFPLEEPLCCWINEENQSGEKVTGMKATKALIVHECRRKTCTWFNWRR